MVTLPDVEAMVIGFLNARLTPDFSTRVPKPRPARFGVVWRTGGGAANRVVERAQVTVTCWAADSVTASSDAGAARHELLNNYTGMPLVRGVEDVSGPYYDPDPDTGLPRYSFTMQLNVRGKR